MTYTLHNPKLRDNGDLFEGPPEVRIPGFFPVRRPGEAFQREAYFVRASLTKGGEKQILLGWVGRPIRRGS